MINLVRFYYTEIKGERFNQSLDKLKIETSLNIKSIENLPQKNSLSGTSFLSFSFSSSIDYSKEIAKIELSGKMILSMEDSVAKEILNSWKKKEIKEEMKIFLFNGILEKTNIKALQLEEELGLPPHFKMPSLSLTKKE